MSALLRYFFLVAIIVCLLSGCGQGESRLKANIIRHQRALLQDKLAPTSTPPHPSVAVIEFYDVNCGYCHKMLPVMTAIMKHYPNVQYIFKEFPVFAKKWASSEYGAQMGLALYKSGGFTAFIAYHNRIFSSNKSDGKLTIHYVNTIAKEVAKQNAIPFARIIKSLPLLAQDLRDNVQLGINKLTLQGVPVIIVMPIKKATNDSISLFQGYASYHTLALALNIASKAGEK